MVLVQMSASLCLMFWSVFLVEKFGQPSDRNGQILLCLRDMVSTNHIHQQAVNALMCPGSKYSHLEIPQLFKESFIGMDD